MFTTCKFGIFPSKIEILQQINVWGATYVVIQQNNRHYGNIFPLIRSTLYREIQGLSFDAWYATEIMWVKGCKLEFYW